MRRVLRAAPLVAAACVCIGLMCIGTMAAIGLVLLDVFLLFGGLAEGSGDIAGGGLFGLVTVSLTGVNCFLALLFLTETCIDALAPEGTVPDKRKILVSVLVVAVTIGQWWSARSSWFLPVCALTDALHLTMLLNGVRKMRKRI